MIIKLRRNQQIGHNVSTDNWPITADTKKEANVLETGLTLPRVTVL